MVPVDATHKYVFYGIVIYYKLGVVELKLPAGHGLRTVKRWFYWDKDRWTIDDPATSSRNFIPLSVH